MRTKLHNLTFLVQAFLEKVDFRSESFSLIFNIIFIQYPIIGYPISNIQYPIKYPIIFMITTKRPLFVSFKLNFEKSSYYSVKKVGIQKHAHTKAFGNVRQNFRETNRDIPFFVLVKIFPTPTYVRAVSTLNCVGLVKIFTAWAPIRCTFWLYLKKRCCNKQNILMNVWKNSVQTRLTDFWNWNCGNNIFFIGEPSYWSTYVFPESPNPQSLF